jgi:GNAT superfamily N-acetyltransferase
MLLVEQPGKLELEELAQVLARAFERDPLACYVFPDANTRNRRLIRTYTLYLRFFLHRGRVWTNPGRTAAALWLPPGRYPLAPGEHLRLLPRMIAATGLASFPAASRVLNHLDTMHPEGSPFWYLGVLGVDPVQQGRGVGSELLASGLRMCDTACVGAYLETAEPSNLPFYARFGFTELRAAPMRGGPQVWGLWREPEPRADVHA